LLGQNGKNGAVALKDRKDAHSKPGRRLHSRMCNEGAHSQTPSAHQFVQFMDGTELAPSSYIRSLSIKSSEFHHTQCSIAEYDGTLSYPFLECLSIKSSHYNRYMDRSCRLRSISTLIMGRVQVSGFLVLDPRF
jgi:hypothetical protein